MSSPLDRVATLHGQPTLERRQTSMLQWLRRRGHQVDFGRELVQPPSPIRPLADRSLESYEGTPCPYCEQYMGGTRNPTGRRRPTRDHVRPRRSGATLANGNCLIVCATCNNEKGNMMLSEFAAWLSSTGDRRAPIVLALIAARVSAGLPV